jgi:hypothetical protein
VEDVGLSWSYRGSVLFYAVVSDEIHQIIDFFRTPAEAEVMVAVLEDEPDGEDILWV